MRPHRPSLFILAVVLLACGDPRALPELPDASMDASLVDARVSPSPDGGGADGGPSVDSGAAPERDGGPLDPPDASTSIDGGGESRYGPTADQMAYDMFGAPFRDDGRRKDGILLGAAPWAQHEAFPRGGNMAWDWFHGSRFGADPPWNDFMIPWGQLFADAAGNDVWNVRLQVRRVHFLYLDAAGAWREVVPDQDRDVAMQGNFWTERFAGAPGVTDQEKGLRAEGADEGWSVRLRTMGSDDQRVTWHFFYPAAFYPRPAVPAGARAVFSACQMRLIPDGDPNVNLDDARFVASFGADHWPRAEGGRLPGDGQITPFYQPRMKYVTSEWRWFTGHTATDWFDGSAPNAAAMNDGFIRANPPELTP